MEVKNMKKNTIPIEENAENINDYSIHTVEIGIRLRRKEVTELKEKLNFYVEDYLKNNVPDQEWSHLETKYKYIPNLFDIGISKIRVEEHYVERMFVCGYLCFKLNPRLLLGYTDYKSICIVPANELENVIPALKSAWTKYLDEEIVERAILLRVDFCANIMMDSQDQAKRYMKLLAFGKEPTGMEYTYFYNKKQHRKVRFHNGITLTGKQCELSIYLKQDQMINQNENQNGYHDEAEIQIAEGQIRFELRVKRRKINYISGKYLECPDTAEFFANTAFLSKKFLIKYLLMMYGSGRFVKLSDARNMIMTDRSLHMNTRRNYIRLLEEIKCSGFDKYFHDLRILDKNAYDTVLRFRREIENKFGISLITMPECWPEKYFENPLTYTKFQNVNERK